MLIGAAMARLPEASIPQRAGAWSQASATYRFLNNPRVTSEGIQHGAIQRTRQACAASSVVLCLHDLTQLKPVYDLSDTKLMQHTVLAVSGDAADGSGGDSGGGRIHGVLAQRWFDDPQTPKGETRDERRERWTRSQVWPEAVRTVGRPPAASPRWVMVADREADDFQVFHACHEVGQGFVIRSQHNRYLTTGERLREMIRQQPVAGGLYVSVARHGQVGQPAPPERHRRAQPGRRARLEVRYASVELQSPRHDPRYHQPLAVQVVQVREIDPPAHVESPIDWLLLTREPVTCLTDALRVVEWYDRRWLIEELHKAQKTGCQLEKAQLQDAPTFTRLAAIATLTAVRLLQLRDQAAHETTAREPAMRHVEELWVRVVSRVANHRDPATLTLRAFYHAIARQGGWLGRRRDGPPGWQTLWRGWQRIATYVEGIELMQIPKP